MTNDADEIRAVPARLVVQAEDAEASRRWVRDGVVTQEYLARVLGDPLVTVCATPHAEAGSETRPKAVALHLNK